MPVIGDEHGSLKVPLGKPNDINRPLDKSEDINAVNDENSTTLPRPELVNNLSKILEETKKVFIKL